MKERLFKLTDSDEGRKGGGEVTHLHNPRELFLPHF